MDNVALYYYLNNKYDDNDNLYRNNFEINELNYNNNFINDNNKIKFKPKLNPIKECLLEHHNLNNNIYIKNKKENIVIIYCKNIFNNLKKIFNCLYYGD
jgi:hypothetical protein